VSELSKEIFKKVNVLYLKIEVLLAEFTGVLVSMLVCALIALHGPGGLAHAFSAGPAPALELSKPEPEKPLLLSLPEADENRNLIRDLYQDPDYRDWVESFFTSLCGSPDIAAVILANADTFDVAPALAFALCWEESRYNPRAINRANRDESVDRGLFQLNNRSFPKIAEADFFNPGINAWYGMAHLRVCLDSGESEIAALAMYNAGTGRVRSLGAPKNTLDYIHRILEYQRKIERAFQVEARRETAFRLAANSGEKSGGPRNPELFPAETGGLGAGLASAKPVWPRPARLGPLAGRR
jgi:hypothetical protein